MITINRIKLDIIAHPANSTLATSRFGFDIPFEKGLNIISGLNTTGKSTILSCIYYALCVEQLLGSSGINSLKDSLRTMFEFDSQKWTIISSVVFIEIENNQGVQKTIKRPIVGNDIDVKRVIVYDSAIQETYFNINSEVKFITERRNHESEYGYYKWFADFAQIEIPFVYNFNSIDKESPLYLQTVFSAFFIEQTKGWSDFLSTCPNFGIKKNKEKVFEFILNLKQLSLDLEIEKIEAREKELKVKWREIYDKIDIYAKANLGKVIGLPENPVIDEKELIDTAILIRQNEDSDSFISSSEKLRILEEEYAEIVQLPIKKTLEKKGDLRATFQLKNATYQKFKQKYDDFLLDLSSQQSLLMSYEEQAIKLEDEKKANQDIKKILDENEKNPDYKICPTCNQNVLNSIRSQDLEVHEMTITENINFLDNQSKLLKGAITGLKKIIKEKESIQYYYIKELSVLEQELKIIQDELIAPDNYPSLTDTYQRLNTQNQIREIQKLESNFWELIADLNKLSEDFKTIVIEKEGLDLKIEEDNTTLDLFKNEFVRYLRLFEFTSTYDFSKISIQKEAPFKYLPVINYNGYPQKINIGSSASDGIRSLWAYYLTLLKQGVNHFGVLIIDEPGQHKMKLSSLKVLIKECSNIKDKQIILSTSKESNLDEGRKIDLDLLLEGLQENIDYTHYKIEDGKSIKRQ